MLLIMPSAMVWNLALSPAAFWMSASTPAAVKASVRNLRSAVSHRADDAASGRMTPTLAFAAGEEAPVLAPAPELLLEQAARANADTESPATARRERLRM